MARFALCLPCLLWAVVSAAQSNSNSPLGVNVREIRYWGTEMHLLDFFKRAGNGSSGVWLTQCAAPCNNGNTWNTQEQALLDLDAAGWPKSLPDANSTAKYRWVTTILWMNSGRLPLGRWTVLYDGECTLSYGQANVLRNVAASQPGRDAVDVSAGANTLTVSITATDPNRSGNYLRNIRVIAPGGGCGGDPFSYVADASACPGNYRPFADTYASQPFHPQFLSDLRPFAALRFMQFFSTNVDQTTKWSERSLPTDISWGYNATRGAPIEVALDMANSVDASPWLAIPAMVDDDYIRQYARLAKARLSTMRPIYIEYGNEVWNGSYPYSIAGQWVQAQGKARWPNSAETDFAKQMNWFGMRTKQICSIWKQEFAERASQVKCVMGAQGAGSWVADHYILSCPLYAAEPGATACNGNGGIDALAGGYYFGGHVSNPALQSAIESQWLSQADGGLAKLFQEITSGDGLTPPAGWGMARSSVALIASQMAANKLVADRHGLAMVVYEGGNELHGQDSSSYQVRLQALFERAERDPRMGEAYSAVLNAWKSSGGELYMVFESTGAYSAVRGNSTLLEWTGQTRADAPKYDAVLSYIAANPCWWTACALQFDVDLRTGWNLLGNGIAVPINVAVTFNDVDKVASVWKWLPSGSSAGVSYPAWAYYSPALPDGGRTHAATRGYELLSTINAGEGYWVNAKADINIALPTASAVLSSSFAPTGAHALAHGWSLIASGDRPSPAGFAAALNYSGDTPNLSSLWAWDAIRQTWYFWSPALAASGGLAAYLTAKGYASFADLAGPPAGTLAPARGYWVNLP